MATYNGEPFIQRQLESFIEQRRQPDEIVICDDCSSDSTLSIVKKFASNAPFEVKFFENSKNLGYKKNFEKALSLCTGDLIFLSDQDDVWLPEKISVIEQEFSKNGNIFLVRSNMIIADSDLQPSRNTQLSNITALGMRTTEFNTGCGMAMRKAFLKIGLPLPEENLDSWGHDRWLGKLAEALNVSSVIERPLMFYRRHGNNASNWIASETAQLSQFSAVKVHGLQKSTAGWNEAINRLRDIEVRIQERCRQISNLSDAINIQEILRSIHREQSILEQRIEIVSKPRFRRSIPIIIYWLAGGYQRFSGWKSAMKDIVRP